MSSFIGTPVLVTGASGHLGRIAVEELLARGASRIVAGTRDPSKLADLSEKGVDVRRMDFDQPDTLPAAFAGVERVLIVSTDTLGQRLAQHRAAIDAAKASGAKHIVYTSAPAARPNPDSGVGYEHYWTEQAIAGSGLDFTILRNNMYTDFVLMGIEPTLASGKHFYMEGDRGTALVTRADTARTAAGALLKATGQLIEDVSGPAVVTNVQRAALFSQISGKRVDAVPLSAEQLHAGMISNGLPGAMADIMIAFQKDAAIGYQAVVTDVVERYSGRRPESLEAFLEANKAALGV